MNEQKHVASDEASRSWLIAGSTHIDHCDGYMTIAFSYCHTETGPLKGGCRYNFVTYTQRVKRLKMFHEQLLSVDVANKLLLLGTRCHIERSL